MNLSQPRIPSIIKEDSPWNLRNNPNKPETRGKKSKSGEMELDQVERTLDSHTDIEWMNWNEIPVRMSES